MAIGQLLIGLFGGLALFLFGMGQMTAALKATAGGGMRSLLTGLTRNRFMALFTGAFVTAVIQSSSVTTVLVVGFISAGLMSVTQSVGVIIGANIGTTITAQIIAFKVTEYALLLIAAGFGAHMISRNERVRQIGLLIMGLGLVFFGMSLMSDATSPLRSFEPFIQAMASMEKPLYGIAAAAVFTALVQSSSATTGIVIVLASQGFITLEAGITLALGANIGTCVTAVIAAIGKRRPAVQAAGVHVLFNVVGVLIWVPLIPDLAEFVRTISPLATDLTGAEKMAAEVPRQVANAHTAFNVANALIMIWFTGPIAKLICKLLPDKPSALDPSRPKFLEDIYLDTPALAVDRLRLEIGNLGDLARSLIHQARYVRSGRSVRASLRRGSEDMRLLYDAIVDYARRVLEKEASETDVRDVEEILQVANHLHSMGDTISVNVQSMASQLEIRGVDASPATREAFSVLVRRIEEVVAESVSAFVERDHDRAQHVIGLKHDISGDAREIERHLARRLQGGDSNQLVKYRLENAVLEVLKRIYYFAKRIAKTVPAKEPGQE